MSADNGIYILQTPHYTGDKNNFDYRVIHAQAIENIFFENKDGNSMEVIKYFGKAEVFDNHKKAMEKAREMEKEIFDSSFPVLEYGISTITLKYPFQFFVNNAKYEVIEKILKYKNEMENELGHRYSGIQGSLLFSCNDLEILFNKGLI